MTPLPKVTVVTPSYNQGRFLEETIGSVLAQDYPNLEYIVIDGGSTDESVAIIKKYAPQLAHWESAPDEGQADAINKGFRRATGDLFAYLNSDDLIYPGFVSGMVRLFERHPEADLIYRDVEQGEDPQHVEPRRGEAIAFPDMLRTLRIPIPQQASMWRRSLFEKIGPFDPKWRVVLDREFFLKAGLSGTILYVPGTVGFFRFHATSKSVAEERRWIREIPEMYRRFFETTRLPADLAGLRAETMSAAYIFCARIARTHGESLRAAWLIARAIAAYPKSVLKIFKWGPSQIVAEALAFFRR